MENSRLNRLCFLLICAIVVFSTMAYGTVHQPVIAFFYLAVATLTVLWAVDSFKSGHLRLSTSRLQVPLLLLGVYGLAQIIPFGSVVGTVSTLEVPRTISVDPFSTQLTSIHIFALCLFFAAVLAFLNSRKRLRLFVNYLTVFGFIFAFFAILQSVLSPGRIYGIYEPISATPFGSFVNRHNFAAIIEMTMSLPLALLFTGAVDRDKRLLYWIAVALMATSLLLSGSRGGLIAILGGMVFLAFLTIRRSGKGQAIASVGLIVAIIILALGGAVFVGGDTSLTRFTDAAAANDLSSSRTHIWQTTLLVIVSFFPFGAGMGAFGQAYTRFDLSGGSLRVEQAHNDYLQLLADAGIVGLVLGGLFLYWLFREGARNIRAEGRFRRGVAIGACTGCFAILIHSLFDFVLHITAVSVMFLTFLGLLVASGRKFDDTDLDEIGDRPTQDGTVTQISRRPSEK